MKKLFTFLFAALMSVSMFGATTVTWNTNDITGSGKSFTKDGVTITVAYDINFEQKNFEGGGTFTTTLGNFTKIEVTADDVYTVSGDGWSGDIAKKTWTGNASSVSFTDNIYGNGGDITFVFTIEASAPTTYTLKLVTDPEKGSIVVTVINANQDGTYTVPANTEVTIHAIPNEGYEFTGWKEGNTLCDFTECGVDLNTNDNPLKFTMTKDVAYKAEFAAVTPEPDFAGEGTEASPFLIATADDWNLLATRVSEGNTYSGEYFQLTDNIAISTMVGLSDHNFNGTFDGAGHTITATLSSDADCCAPFAYTYGATIKNLHVTGTLTATGTHAGGVVGRNGAASLTLINVSSSMTIIANATNSNGGLVGYTINATLSGCAFTGKLLTEQNRRLGGMVGWKSNTTGSYLTITDCVFDPEEVTIGNSGSKTFAAYGGGTVTFTNCYYTQAISADQGKQMRAITAGEGVLVLNTGSATIYNVSGITSYGTGISYDNVLYGGNGDEISLNLSGSDYGYEASTGTLSGTENPYKLTMADADCQITKLAPTPTAVENVQTNPVQATKILRDGMLLIVRDGKLFNLTGAQVR